MVDNRSVNPRVLANSVCDTLIRNGHQALLVGGCVRDLLLSRAPADYDVATDAVPDRVLQLFPGGVAVGAQFGVVLIPGGEQKVEVATFRSDIGYSDGRHPDQVVFSSTPEQDVERRDFTINGLLLRHDTDEVIDYVGGQADLRAGILRTIGEPALRFAEDKLRMLRAIRFAARFGFAIDPATFQAIRGHAAESAAVSAERTRDELTKLLTEGAARRGFELLEQSGLLAHLLPEVAAMKGVEQPPQFHPEGDVWTHTLLMLGGIPAAVSPTLAWGVLLHDVGKPPTFRPASQTGDRIRFDGHVEAGLALAAAICKRLRFSGEQSAQILALVANHMKFKDVAQMRLATLKRFVRQPCFEQHLELHRLDCLSSSNRLDSYELVLKFLAETPAEQVRPDRLLTGDDLQSLGFRPGPRFSHILGAIEEAQLDGAINNKTEALAYVQKHFPASSE
jgi:tRNA nucleotidyltransferase/poly(A) polymerase